MKASAHFEERRDPAAQDGPARGGLGDSRKDLEQRAFARAVAADHADDLAGLHFERHIAQRPEIAVKLRLRRRFSADPLPDPMKLFAKRSRIQVAETIAFGN